MVSSKSYLYRLSVECAYYITEVSILQGNPAKQVLKTIQKQSCGNWLFLTTLLFVQYYFFKV